MEFARSPQLLPSHPPPPPPPLSSAYPPSSPLPPSSPSVQSPSEAPSALSPAVVLSLLQRCAAPDAAVRSAAQAEAAFAALRVGYRTSLAYLALSAGAVADDCRLLAAIQLKHSVDGLFAPSAPLCAAPGAAEERAALKTALLEQLAEPVDAISTQRALAVAAVARYESTKQWPALLPRLLEAIAAPPSASLLSLRSSFTLHCVLKALQAKRTPLAKATFASVTTAALPVIAGAAQQHARRLCELLQSAPGGRLSDEQLQEVLAHGRLATLQAKALRRLVAFGVDDIGSSPDCRAVVTTLCDVVRFLTPLYPSVPAAHPLHAALSSLLLALVHVLSEAQREQPLAFRAFLTDAVSLADFVVVHAVEGQGEVGFEELTVAMLTLLARLLREPVYQRSAALRSALTFSHSGGGLRADPVAAAEAQDTFARLFSPAYATHLARTLLATLFPLSPSELAQWTTNAEQAILEQSLDEEKARPAALRILGLVAQQHPDDVGGLVLQSCQQLLFGAPAINGSAGVGADQSYLQGPLSPASPSPSSPRSPHPLAPSEDVAALNGQSSAYLALGCVCHDLPPRLGKTLPSFSFASFFDRIARPQLHALLAASSPGSPTLTAVRCGLACRLLWCVGEWCESLPISSHQAVYESAGLALSHADLRVRFAAARCLERFVVAVVGLDEAGDARRVYAAYVERVFRVCVALIEQLDELELQTSVMQLVRSSVASLHAAVEPAVPFLLSALPFLWDAAGDANHPLRLTLLDTTTELTRSLGCRSAALQPFCVQAVAYALDPQHASDRSFLHALSLELWAALMQTATAWSAALLDLFPLLPAAFHAPTSSLELSESLPVALEVVESYALLGGRAFMLAHGQTVSALLAGWMERVSERGLISLACTLETLAQLFPAEAPRAFAQPLQLILRALLESRRSAQAHNGDAHRTPAAAAGAQSPLGELSALATGHFLYVLARLFFAHYDGAVELLQVTDATAWQWALHALLHLWLERLDSVAEVYKRKLALLAVARVLLAQRQSEAVLPCVVDFLVGATGVQEELDQAEADAGAAERGRVDPQTAAEAEEARLSQGTETERRRLLSEADPANAASVLSDALSVLSELQRAQPAAFHARVEQQIPAAIQHSVQRLVGAAKQRDEQSRAHRASPLSATLPSSSSLLSSSLQLPSSSMQSGALPSSHSHPSLQSLYQQQQQQ